MSEHEQTIEELLRGHGLRNTPQRHAILTALRESPGEHLSADEVHARASRSLHGLGRGTVYATLSELTGLGALSAVGLPEPVRYEANTRPHGHFRCRLCMRLFDLDGDPRELEAVLDARFTVERVTLRSEGVCADCGDYQAGLREGVLAIHARGRPAQAQLLERTGLACAQMEGPLGTLLLAATPAGLARVAFEDHADVAQLRERARSRRGAGAAREHLRDARAALERFLAGDDETLDCTVDPATFTGGGEALRATRAIAYGSHSSYTALKLSLPAREIGFWMGANPVAIVLPCHRVSRGREVPQTFVGGLERRQWLEAHERERVARRPANSS